MLCSNWRRFRSPVLASLFVWALSGFAPSMSAACFGWLSSLGAFARARISDTRSRFTGIFSRFLYPILCSGSMPVCRALIASWWKNTQGRGGMEGQGIPASPGQGYDSSHAQSRIFGGAFLSQSRLFGGGEPARVRQVQQSPWTRHNYVLEVTVAGEPDPATGMVLDLKELKDILQREMVDRMDHRHLNHEVPELAGKIPTCENIAAVIWNLSTEYQQGRLDRVRLYESPDLFADCTAESNAEARGARDRRTLTHATLPLFGFAPAAQPKFSAEENLRLYGKCNSPYGHGHNYVFEVTIAGPVDPATGMIANLGDLDPFVEREVIEPYDQKYLNEEVLEFRGRCRPPRTSAAKSTGGLKFPFRPRGSNGCGSRKPATTVSNSPASSSPAARIRSEAKDPKQRTARSPWMKRRNSRFPGPKARTISSLISCAR